MDRGFEAWVRDVVRAIDAVTTPGRLRQGRVKVRVRGLDIDGRARKLARHCLRQNRRLCVSALRTLVRYLDAEGLEEAIRECVGVGVMPEVLIAYLVRSLRDGNVDPRTMSIDYTPVLEGRFTVEDANEALPGIRLPSREPG